MQHHTKFSQLFTGLLPILLCIVAVGGLLLAAQPAAGDTVNGNVCMQTLFTAGGNSQTLGCTANDVRIASAGNVRDPVTNQPITSCIGGGTPPPSFTFKADFTVQLTAQTRYDIGLYFAADGDPNGDGARTGQCTVSTVDVTNAPAQFINLDASPDNCGEIVNDAAHNPMIVTLTLTAACVDTDGDGNVNLPNCTSWRQPGSNQVCDAPTDAFPGSPSKCKCDDTFGIPVIVETAKLTVVKEAAPTTVPETGGTVTYSVEVTNNAQFVSVEIDTLIDDIYGNLHDPANPAVTDNTCPGLVGDVLAPGDSTSCEFKAFVSGDFQQQITDTVEVCGAQQNTGATICDDDDATVTITDVPSTPGLTKTAQSTAACRVDVNYQVVVSNNSAIDTLTLSALSDNQFGNITSVQGNVISTTCGQSPGPGALPAQIAPLGNYTCTFVGRITGSGTACQNLTHVDTVTGTVTDDDGVGATPSDTATVNVIVSFP
jgi:hypothetical protein